MTTIVYRDGILAVDSRHSISQYDSAGRQTLEMNIPWNKLNRGRHFVVAGAGNAYFVSLLSLMPMLAWMAICRYGIAPYWGRRNDGNISLIAGWRTRSIWYLNVSGTSWGPFVLFRRTKFLRFSAHEKGLTMIAGSGSDHLTIAEVQAIGAEDAIARAAQHDCATDALVQSFDILSWTDRAAPFPTPKGWARIRHIIACVQGQFFFPIPLLSD